MRRESSLVGLISHEDVGIISFLQIRPYSILTIKIKSIRIKNSYKYLFWWQVGWVKADTKAIQAIHEHVITHNPRVSVSRNDHNVWNLHIHNVQEEDSGQYMCQINTNPMESQVIYGFSRVF